MQLTSGFLLAVVVILYLAFFGVLIFRWNAIKNILVRATSIIVINLLLLMSVGLALNNSYGFYNSWNELFGISTQGKRVINPSQIDLSKAKYTSNGSAMLHLATELLAMGPNEQKLRHLVMKESVQKKNPCLPILSLIR